MEETLTKEQKFDLCAYAIAKRMVENKGTLTEDVLKAQDILTPTN